jgi:glycosyltransferase involved in cell wall biosynthesis
MHAVYGSQVADASLADGFFFDDVIPNSFVAQDFPQGEGGDYLLYVGRLTARKGLAVVKDLAERTGIPLVIAGEGDESLIPPGADYRGLVGPEERAKLMGGALALICPTLYLEPFGGVAVEAQMCGTPVLSTDWGAFPETVAQGRTGFRCRTLSQFAEALSDVGMLDRDAILARALSTYSTDVVRYLYEDYFALVATLAGAGWYA